jgi:hypothetical protein
MRRTKALPSDWKQRTKEYVKSGKSAVYEVLWSPLGESHQQRVLGLLDDDEIASATEILWKAAKDLPKVQEKFHEHIGDMLISLVQSSVLSLKSRTSKECRAIVEALRKVRDDAFYIREGEALTELDRTIVHYQEMAIHAPKTKPIKRHAKDFALQILRPYSVIVFGHYQDEAIGLFMHAFFGSTGDAATVQTRYSELKKERRRNSEPECYVDNLRNPAKKP